MVAREIRLAFGAVDDEHVDRFVLRGRELHVRRKRGASHADETGVANDRFDLFGVQTLPAAFDVEPLHPFVRAVGHDDRGGHVGADRVRKDVDRLHGARGRRVEGHRDESLRLGDDLALLDRIPLLDDRLRRGAQVLRERNDESLGQRHRLYGKLVRQILVIRRMNAAVESSCRHQASPPAAALSSTSTSEPSIVLIRIVFIGQTAAIESGISKV